MATSFVFYYISWFDIIIFVITLFLCSYSRFYKLFFVYEYLFLNFQFHISIFWWLIVPLTLSNVSYYSYQSWITIFRNILYIIFVVSNIEYYSYGSMISICLIMSYMFIMIISDFLILCLLVDYANKYKQNMILQSAYIWFLPIDDLISEFIFYE